MKKRGRKEKEIDLEQVEKLAQIQATEEEMAFVLGISQDTFTRRKKKQSF